MIDLSVLNENQREAVLWTDTPLLVLAGPGSGKTRVLTYRIARILEETDGQHFRILALTFTNKAAAEMRERVETLIPAALDRVRLTTFHSYAAELLQQHGSHLNFSPDFQILSNDADREALLDQVLGKMRKDPFNDLPQHFTASQLLPAITKLLDRCVHSANAEQVLLKSKIDNAISLARVYVGYREALRTANSLDFPSLIAESLELLEKNPFLVKHIRKVYKHILLDEFQDTNKSQYQILSLIAKPDPSTLFIVADDDQIIYQWNGASPERIKSLRNDFHVSEIQLPENYRCPSQVIELANSLIAKNLNRSAGKKPLTAVKQGSKGDVVRVFSFNTADDEIAWIVNDITSKTIDERRNCAILARTNKLIDLVGTALKNADIPVYYSARKDEFTSAPMRMLHSLLRLVNSDDKRALSQLSKAFYEIEGIRVELSPVLSRASADGQDLLHAWLDEAALRKSEMRKETLTFLDVGLKPLFSALNFHKFSENLLAWAGGCRDKSQPDNNAFSEFAEECEVWHQILSDISKKFAGEDLTLHQLIHELDLTSKAMPKVPGSIPCFTIHSSKGMEFGHVYLMGLVEDQLPSWAAVKKGPDSIEMQEERRNCFVAITRAQESLTLTFSKQVFGWTKSPSRFLEEMGIEI